MKKTIEQQIAELTPEQKNNMGKIYKKYIISLIAIVLIGVLTALGLFVETSIREEQAKDRYDRIQTTIALNQKNNKLDLSLFEESSKALDEYFDMRELKPLSFAIGSGICFIGVLVVYFIFKRKYPYFSEKKYAYLKKAEQNITQE